MSIGPWNTGTGGAAVCEDMPRKSIDIKLSEYPVQQKREHCALFLPSGEDGSGQSPGVSQRADSLRVCTAILWALGEPFGIYICNFQGSFEPIFYGLFFIDYLTLPYPATTAIFAQKKKDTLLKFFLLHLLEEVEFKISFLVLHLFRR